jgi:hypothetical protein
VFVADGGLGPDLSHEAKGMGSDIRTARVVAQIFREQFFAPVRRLKARLDGYLRNGSALTIITRADHLLQMLF